MWCVNECWNIMCDLRMDCLKWSSGDKIVRCVVLFKQKTAYEMRISDWSSDVCSSDLLDVGEAVLAERRANWQARTNDYGSGALWRYAQNVGPEIGRASCRERVCLYV